MTHDSQKEKKKRKKTYMAHDFISFSPILLDVFRALYLSKTLVNGFANIVLFNIIYIGSNGTLFSSKCGFLL